MASIAFSLLIFCLVSYVPSSSHAQNAAINLPLKAVNLGNWLVTEGWMDSSRFDGIINKDLLLWRVNETCFNFRAFNKQFLGLGSQGLESISNTPSDSETFQIVRNDDLNRVRLRAPNGLFLQAQMETLVTADYAGSSWDDNDPSVFKMTIVANHLRGEFQITNGYGPDIAPQIMQDHWNSYITEEDFSFMSANGLTAVRIPVGWWIAQDPTPPKPFVGGSSDALDRAFTWAEKYGMKVIIDLHALKASQNGNEHSGARDGYQEWGDANIDETVAVIEFLAASNRYAASPSLAAIELMNEPVAPGVTFDALTKYYKAAYDAVRKHTNAYVILSNRLGPIDSKELLAFASGLDRVVIDVHYYNLFSDSFKNMNVQQNIDFVNNQRASDLGALTSANGPLVLVGEWTAEFARNDATKEDYQKFAQAQIDVYGRATFGWAYWAYKCELNHWSIKWMIENNYIKL
ncbi:Glycoside hydrolase, family 5 [Corchorus olitorius]|uniref:Glycoside hydrolase, family 5 n=1 Tax=Corchorus olitorius TaxID=93759 RepID=A0A1R3KAP7_9ROSI|nr:Glycoside hydrolase, family 5 [Corchorus olitorius]